MSQQSIELGRDNITVSVGDEFEVISESVPELLGGNWLEVGDRIEIIDINGIGSPQGIEFVMDGDAFRYKKHVSPTTLSEALGTVDYLDKYGLEQTIERV